VRTVVVLEYSRSHSAGLTSESRLYHIRVVSLFQGNRQNLDHCINLFTISSYVCSMAPDGVLYTLECFSRNMSSGQSIPLTRIPSGLRCNIGGVSYLHPLITANTNRAFSKL
jgi:hypothetical protein